MGWESLNDLDNDVAGVTQLYSYVFVNSRRLLQASHRLVLLLPSAAVLQVQS